MRLRDYREDLISRLRDPEYACGYLEQAILLDDHKTFLLALHNVIEAAGGMSVLSKKTKLKRQSLYKIVSKRGNPTLYSLSILLKALGMQLSLKTIRKAA